MASILSYLTILQLDRLYLLDITAIYQWHISRYYNFEANEHFLQINRKEDIIMERKVSFGVLAVLLVSGFILVGHSMSASAAEPAPQTIKIGAMISLTGPDAAIGGPAKLGYELAIEEINKAGGVMVKAYGKKVPLELVLLDMETNPEKAIARAESLNAQKVPVAVGTTLIGSSAEIFEKNKLPVVASIMTINAIMDRGFKHFFNIGTLNNDVARSSLTLSVPFPRAPCQPSGPSLKSRAISQQSCLSSQSRWRQSVVLP